MRLRPDCCCRHFVQAILFVQSSAAKPGVSSSTISDFMAFAQVRLQTCFDMTSYFCHCLTAIAIVKVVNPTSYGGVDLPHYPFKRFHRCNSSREMSHAIFDRLQGFLRGLNVGIVFPGSFACLHPDAKAEKIKPSLIGIDGLRLCLIQVQF